MAFLYFLQDIRFPFLDTVMSLVTRLGEEIIFIAVALLFLWCIQKEEGYYLLTIGFTGLLFNQFLKIFCRIPRPWVKDPAFPIVESAREAASGYSFPSGHTQTAVGTYAALGRWHSQRVLRWIMGALCLLVPFSRMYLGVHTPLDVGVSFLFALTLVFAYYPFFKTLKNNPNRLFYLLGVMFLLAVAFVLYVELAPFPADVDANNLASARKNAYTLLGSLLGFALIYFLDVKFYHYETKAPFLAQVLKLVLGAAIVILMKSLLKEPLYALFRGHHVADAVRYFLLFAAAGGLWPLTFPYFTKISLYLTRKR